MIPRSLMMASTSELPFIGNISYIGTNSIVTRYFYPPEAGNYSVAAFGKGGDGGNGYSGMGGGGGGSGALAWATMKLLKTDVVKIAIGLYVQVFINDILVVTVQSGGNGGNADSSHNGSGGTAGTYAFSSVAKLLSYSAINGNTGGYGSYRAETGIGGKAPDLASTSVAPGYLQPNGTLHAQGGKGTGLTYKTVGSPSGIRIIWGTGRTFPNGDLTQLE